MEGSGDLDGALEELKKFEYFYAVPTTIEKHEKDHHLFVKGKIYRWRAIYFIDYWSRDQVYRMRWAAISLVIILQSFANNAV